MATEAQEPDHEVAFAAGRARIERAFLGRIVPAIESLLLSNGFGCVVGTQCGWEITRSMADQSWKRNLGRVNHVSGLREIVDGSSLFLVDLWGVVHDGARPFPHAREALRELHKLGAYVIFITNTSRLANEVEAHLAKMGIVSGMYDGVVSAGEAAFRTLRNLNTSLQKCLGRSYMTIGYQPGSDWFWNLPFERVTSVEEAEFLIAFGLFPPGTERSDYEITLRRAARRALTLVCANPDEYVMIDGQVYLTAGSLARWYEQMGGRVIRFGKPSPAFYQECLSNIGPRSPRHIVAIGDSLLTDITGARQLGMQTVLVSDTGVHAHEFVGVGSAFGLEQLVTRYGVYPDALMPSLRW